MHSNLRGTHQGDPQCETGDGLEEQGGLQLSSWDREGFQRKYPGLGSDQYTGSSVVREDLADVNSSSEATWEVSEKPCKLWNCTWRSLEENLHGMGKDVMAGRCFNHKVHLSAM